MVLRPSKRPMAGQRIPILSQRTHQLLHVPKTSSMASIRHPSHAMSTFFAKFPATPSMKPQDLIGCTVNINGKPAGTVTKAVQVDPDTINVQVDATARCPTCDSPLSRIGPAFPPYCPTCRKCIDTVHLQKWMADWIRAIGDWSIVPEAIEHIVRTPEDVNEIVARAIESYTLTQGRKPSESVTPHCDSKQSKPVTLYNKHEDRCPKMVVSAADFDALVIEKADLERQLAERKELSSNGKDTTRVMGGDSGFNSPAARLDAIPSRLAWFSTKDGEVEVVRKSDVSALLSPLLTGGGLPPCSADNPQFVRMEDGHQVMRCSECDTEYNTGSEGITTRDGLELCIGCQADLRHLYDEDWNLLPNATSEGSSIPCPSPTSYHCTRA